MLDKIKKFLKNLTPKTYYDPETGYSATNCSNSRVTIRKNNITIEYKFDSEGNVTKTIKNESNF